MPMDPSRVALVGSGFLPARGSWMLDLVVLAMVLVVVVLSWSLYVVRYQQNYQLHKRIQLTLGIVLLIAVTAFEIDMRFITDWRSLAEPSPYFSREGWSLAWGALLIHLACALPTTLLWIAVIVAALRHFPSPPSPSPHSVTHRRWGKIAAIGMYATAVTGWIFYYLAFVAS